MSQVKFLHYRVVKDGQVEGKGGATLVFVTGEEGVSFAEAYCSHKDNYNRRLGRCYASGQFPKCADRRHRQPTQTNRQLVALGHG